MPPMEHHSALLPFDRVSWELRVKTPLCRGESRGADLAKAREASLAPDKAAASRRTPKWAWRGCEVRGREVHGREFSSWAATNQGRRVRDAPRSVGYRTELVRSVPGEKFFGSLHIFLASKMN